MLVQSLAEEIFNYFIIIVAFLIFVIAICVSISHTVDIEREKFVRKHSTKLKEIEKLNEEYKFLVFNNYSYSYVWNSKKQFDRFYLSFEIISKTFDNHKKEIDDVIYKTTANINLYSKYIAEINKIKNTDFKNVPKKIYINETKFKEIENTLFAPKIQKPKLDCCVSIYSSYTTPRGRNHYQKERKYNYENLYKMYKNFYSEDIKNIKEHDKKESLLSSLDSVFTKNIYSLSDINKMLSSKGIEPNDKLARMILEKYGYKKWDSSEFYVIKSVQNYRDFVLESADNNGFIIYNNVLKDEGYDKAVKDLEECGLIAPINSLAFLKIDASLCYEGVIYDDIRKFRSFVYSYGKISTFFSINSIRNNLNKNTKGFEQFDDCFAYSLLKNSRCQEITGLKGLFTLNGKNEKISFLIWMMRDIKSIDIYDLCSKIKDEFGIDYLEKSIIYDIGKSKTNLYYNNEMEKIYSKKEYFLEELKERGAL